MRLGRLLSIAFPRAEPRPQALDIGPWTLDFGIAYQSFLFADETVSNTIPCEAQMVRGITTTADTYRQPGEGDGFHAHAVAHGNLSGHS
jgi:hypothetical protein